MVGSRVGDCPEAAYFCVKISRTYLVMKYPLIIQGGMGVAVSGWRLGRAVACLGQLGVVSGTALAIVLARRLQAGDPGGDMRRALSHFPIPVVAERVLADYYIPGGKAPGVPYKPVAMPRLDPRASLVELTVAGNFAEVYLAKEGHDGLVGINFLEKIQLPTLASIYGAMLAKVDFILMGAGIPRAIPGILDRFAEGLASEMRVDVTGAAADALYNSKFDPIQFCGGTPPKLHRPQFLGIISSSTLALTLAKKSSGRVDGFVVEGSTAGGHNAPPRGPLQLSTVGEPVYGLRDLPDLDKIGALELPFWLAGSYGRLGKLSEAQALGAAGVQVGTAFAFCEESDLAPDLKRRVIAMSRAREGKIFTDPLASPTGFPFKVAQMTGTLSDEALYTARERVCDLGYLRQAFQASDGTVHYRCAAEPVGIYKRKGGTEEATVGRKCVCNGLFASIGLGQIRGEGEEELALVTAGEDLPNVADFLLSGRDSYTAKDVIDRLLT